jgi:murein DD-endopeptidase MepM/ murein hydrolase activator NlpD
LRRSTVTILLLVCATVLGGKAAFGSGVATVTSPDGVNLRSAPSTSAQILTVVPLGSVLSLTGDPTPDGWYPVSFGAYTGWASGAYLTQGQVSPDQALNAPPLSSLSPPSPPAAVLSAASPSTNGAGSASLKPASSPSSSALATASAFSSGAGNSAAAPTVLTMTVNTDALNVRNVPSTSGTVLTSVPKGTPVVITGAAVNNWLPVQLSGLTGWMDAAYLSSSSVGSAGTGTATAPTTNSATSLTAAAFGNPTLGTPAGPETGLAVASLPSISPGTFIWPVASRRISTQFHDYHQAIDIDQFPAGGNPAVATADGIVTFAGGDACCSYGLYVIVKHRNGFSSLYSHLSKIEVTQGQIVTQGQELGLTGNTGNSTGPHIHFAMYLNGLPFDPLKVLASGAQFEAGS